MVSHPGRPSNRRTRVGAIAMAAVGAVFFSACSRTSNTS